MKNYESNKIEQDFINIFSGNTNQILIGLTHDLMINFFNSAAENIFQCQKLNAISKFYDDFFAQQAITLPVPHDLLNIDSHSNLLLHEGSFILKNNKKIYIKWQILKLANPNLNQSGFLLVGEDITDYKIHSREAKAKKQEKVIQGEEISLESIIEAMPGNVYWKNNEGIYIGCNNNTVKSLGLSKKEDFIGKTLDQILPSTITHRLVSVDEEIIQTSDAMVIEENGPRLNGELGTYLSQKVPLKDKNNNTVGVLGISFDITERKRNEKKLQEAKAKAELQSRTANIFLENIVANLPANIYWLNKDLIYLGCNERVAKLLGLQSPNEVIGKSYNDFSKLAYWDKGQGESFRKDDLEVLNTGIAKLNVEEPPLPNGEGGSIYYLTSRVPLKNDEGYIIGVAGISVDITDRKKMEKALLDAKERAESANKSKSEFLAAVSHELRIPLTGILGMARILADEAMADYQTKKVKDIIMSGEHLLALVNDLLDLAKLEAGKLELHPAPFNLRKLIEEIATMLTFQAKDKNLELHVHYAPDSPQMLIGDERAIRQILLNLLGNAVKFTAQGYVKIKVECLAQQQLQAELLISVQDTGIGIPPEKLESVFERFNQVDSSRTRRYGGAGLGLTISKAYVDLMGGKIWVESEVNKGSEFLIQAPFPLQDMVNRPSVWEPYRTQLRVLIVDDTLRGEVIAKQLACPRGRVASGAQAFDIILAAHAKKEPFHLIIIDQQLQSLDAMALGARINDQEDLVRPLLILLMPPSTLETRNQAKQAGFYETMTKPVQATELLDELTTAWERWEKENRIKNKTLSIFSDKQPQILLVEDDPIIQKVHTTMLEKVGCKVAVAKNSQEALALYNQGQDAIFMDVGLPGMSGLEIAEEIRRREAGAARVPIIGVTGYGYAEDRQNCLDAGMDDVAIKPLKPEELTQLLVKWLAKEQP